MRRLSLVQFDDLWFEFESLLDQTPEIDPWCSGPDWLVPVHLGFGSDTEPLLLASDQPAHPGFAALAIHRTEDRRIVVGGIEPLWGFASPLVGPDVESLAAQVADDLASRPWDHLMLPGMPELTGPDCFVARVASELHDLGTVGLGTGIVRRVADLGAGYAPWLARRSSRFRRNLGRAERLAGEAGLCFMDLSADAGVFDRLLAIEARSWKGREASGITSPDMTATYRAMVDRLHQRGRLRVLVASIGGRDVGYILGGVRAGVYRGLQLSYTQAAAPLSVGHLLQNRQLRALCDLGEAHTYDLGMDLEYKARWADRAVPTFVLVVNRERAWPLP